MPIYMHRQTDRQAQVHMHQRAHTHIWNGKALNRSHLWISKSIWPGSWCPWGLAQICYCFPACLLYRTHINDLTPGDSEHKPSLQLRAAHQVKTQRHRQIGTHGQPLFFLCAFLLNFTSLTISSLSASVSLSPGLMASGLHSSTSSEQLLPLSLLFFCLS